MRLAIFDAHAFERPPLEAANQAFGHELEFIEARLTERTAPLAAGFPAIAAFANDKLDAATLTLLQAGGTRLIALRSAGFNHVDLLAAERLGLSVARVPAYSPHAVAEHAIALLQALNRKIHRAHLRVRELDFSLDGLVGFDLYGKTAAVVGVGRIGEVMARILTGFGCRVLLYDQQDRRDLARELGAEQCDLPRIYRESDVISLHVPLTPGTRHMIDEAALATMRPGVLLVNTGRGALIDTRALIGALKRRHLGGAALDVYEEEENVFFHDLSDQGLQDDTLARLLTFPNVLITAHQAFLTHEALRNIAETTLQNVADFEAGRPLVNRVGRERVQGGPG
jgi:D-lactate dehydrogenase